MTKTFTLFFLLLGNLFFSIAKNNLHIVEINPVAFDNTAAKTSSATTAFRFENTDYLVIEPKLNSAAIFEGKDVSINSYLGNGLYLIATDADKTSLLLQSIPYKKVGYIAEESKLDESLITTTAAVPVTVMYASGTSNHTITTLAEQTGISIINNDKVHHHFSAYANKSQIDKLVKYPFVYFVTKFYPNKTPLIYNGSLMMGVFQVQEDKPYGFNLKGEGINVGIWDDGAIGNHKDLPVNRNIVIDKNRSSLGFMYHTTEVAGCIGGSGNFFAPLRGTAPRSNMYYWDYIGDLVKEIYTSKNNYSIDISNHSYNFASTNCFQSGLYIPEASDLDKLVKDNPTLLPVVAVGNSASAACASLSDTFSSVDIGFQGCKNALTVGWLFFNEKLVENSGRGPTEDGRIKPELVAKGFGVQTLLPNNSFGVVYGSSYSAPLVAGLAALLYQKYNQLFGTSPNASLIRAILINSARDLGNKGPDYSFGFGKPDAYRAVKSLANSLYFEDGIIQNESIVHNISVSQNTAQLKVTMSWTDKEGNPISNKHLVNDLDLKVVTPSGDTILPWKLNPAIPQNLALRGIDNINNNEQVTIDNPLVGEYKIIVKGSVVPFGPQQYAVAFYTQERKIQITHPNGAEVLDATSSTMIKWNANGIDSLARIEFSSDSGNTWQTVVNNIQLSTQTFDWAVPVASSKNCLIRISSGNNIDVSESFFTVGSQLNYPAINHTVCDKTVKINWVRFTGASAYKVYLFVDSIWTFVGQTDTTTFTINNLTNGKEYMYAISTINNGTEGNHSLAKLFTPISGACTTLNDVGVYAVNSPLGGRKFTSTTLTSSEKISLIIKNFGSAVQNSISVSYKINGGTVRTATLTDIVTSNDTSIIRFGVNENLNAIGNYNLVAWTNLPGDNNSKNDTLYYTIKHLQNNPIQLPFFESFDKNQTEITSATFGMDSLLYMDYYPEVGGRYRTNEGNLYAKTGNAAISLDNYLGTGSKKNELIFTYNLSSYVDSVVFLEFNYMNRAEPDSNDLVFARGDDTKPWIRIYDLFSNRGTPAVYKTVKDINLYQKLKIENGQDFSTSTQLKILHTATKKGITPNNDGGYSFDDFTLFNAGRDVSVLSIEVKKIQCSASFTPQPVSIKITNNSSQTVSNLSVFYKVGNNPAISEIVATPINTNDTLEYSFSALFNYGNPGMYPVTCWIQYPGDKNTTNDTIATSVIVMKTIDTFPYYNDLETNNGNIFSDGINNSWVWATPLKYNMNNAAQDNKAWTTGVEKGYNFNENSSLYMGCMDFSSLTKDPLISFNFLSVMQTQSDSAYAEYSIDGLEWKRLGCYNCGVNWYNGSQNKPVWDRVVFPWQVAHIKVPLTDLQEASNFMYRIRLISDDFVISEGLGIDDIRIFNDYQEIATTDSAYILQTSTGNGWIQFYRNGRLMAELYDDNKNLGNILAGYEANTDKLKTFDNKNIFPRNWVFKPQNPQLGNYKVRLYVLNEEYTQFVINEDSISRMGDIGMMRYIGLNTNLDAFDNHVKSYYKNFTPDDIQFYPYQNGYFVEFETDTLGEFYLISLKQDANAIQNINLVDFSAQKINDDVYLDWKTTREVNSNVFIIQYSFDAAVFIDIDTIPAGGFSSNTTLYNYLHELNATSGIYYYRIKMVDNSNRFSYSLIDSVYFAPNVGVQQNILAATAYVAESDIVIDFKNKLQTPSVVYVYNSLGQLQFTKKMTLDNGINPLGISDFLNWSNGAYYLRIQAKDQSYYSKLMKQKL